MSQQPAEPEVNVPGAYAPLSSLRKGDIPLPSYMGDGTSYITAAADEIDAQIGFIYRTPVTFEEVDGVVPVKSRPAALYLKTMNWLIASGRLVLDLAVAGEDANQHAYGSGMLKQGLDMLKQLSSGEVQLPGAIKADEDEGAADGEFSGPIVFNEDETSLVEGFYQQRSPGQVFPFVPQVRPYGVPGVIRG